MNVSITRCLVILCSLFSAQAWSAFIILEDNRSYTQVIPSSCHHCDVVSPEVTRIYEAEGVDFFYGHPSRPSHLSTLESDKFSGFGEASASGITLRDSGGRTVKNTNTFSVLFTVDQKTDFELFGTFYDTYVYGFTPFSNADLSVSLKENGVEVFGDSPLTPDFFSQRPRIVESYFHYTGHFTPDEIYELELMVSADRLGTHGWDFYLATTTEVPLPAGVWLMLSALGSLVIAKKRSQLTS